MTRFDSELIAALAEGRHDPTEAEALERAIADEPVAAAELAAQRIALDAIGAEPTPMLTVSERNDRRRRVAADLGLAREEAPAPPQRRIAWGSIAVAAAAMVGVIAIVPVVGLLTTSGDADDAAAVSLADDGAAVARSDDLQTEAVPSAPGDTSAVAELTDPTVSSDGGTVTTSAGEDSPTTDAPPATATTHDPAPAAWLSEWRDESADPATAGTATLSTPCYEQADTHLDDEGADSDVLVESTEYSEADAVAFYLVDAAGDVGEIAAFITETCELIATLE